MEINGKPVNLFYSVFVKCEMDRLVMTSGLRDINKLLAVMPTETVTDMAAAMSKAYCDINGGEPITRDEIMRLPVAQITELDNLVAEAMRIGSETTVTTEEPKGKNAKSVAQSN